MTAPITVSDFKSYFTRDFDYGATSDKILDIDISKAIDEASLIFNEGIWADDTEKKIAYYYLTAHFLVKDIQMSGGLDNQKNGLSSSGVHPIQSKSVGPVSVSYGLPQDIINDRVLSQFLSTQYGQKFLQMITPRMIGQILIAPGTTTP